MSWVYFLKKKSKEFEKFRIFHQLLENDVKEKIGTLRIDNEGKLTSNEFKTYCSDTGIRRHLTNIYTPKQNGVVDRMNHTSLLKQPAYVRYLKEGKQRISSLLIFLTNDYILSLHQKITF